MSALLSQNKVAFADSRLRKRRNHKNSPILFLLLLLVIRRPTTDSTTENTQSYCLACIPYFSLETNLVTFLLLLWNYPLIPWHTITQSNAQIVGGVQMTLIYFSKQVERKIQIHTNM